MTTGVAPYRIAAGGNLALHFHAKHLADLRASGLNDETIRAAGVYSIRPSDIAHFFNLRQGVPTEIESALCFPYQGGEFARIKLFPAIGKRMKYEQPRQTGARLYMPFAVDSRPLLVVEGEKKTLAAHQAGFNAVGVGGVWNWLRDGERIADMDLIEWEGRETQLIFDSDTWGRPDLLRAVYSLGRELQAMGARVLVVQIPQPGPGKVGLDDFLLAGGTVQRLEVFSLGHKIFRNCSHWHGRWKFQKAIARPAA